MAEIILNSDAPEAPATFIAAGTRIKGEIVMEGPGRICGNVEGKIIAHDVLEISAEAQIDGDIKAAQVDVLGTIRGNVLATKICRLAPTARLEGELHAASLAIEPGAIFIGKVTVGMDVPFELPAETPSASPAAEAPITGPRLAGGETQAANSAIRVMQQNVNQSLQRNARIIKAAQ